MDNRRFFAFVVASLLILWGWQQFVVIPFLPPQKPAAKPAVKNEAAKKDDQTQPAKQAEGKADPKAPAGDKPAGEKPAEKPPEPQKLKVYPARKDIFIGSADPAAGYRLRVDFDSRGAIIHKITLADRRYADLKDQKQGAVILDSTEPSLKPFSVEIPAIDAQLTKFGDKISLNSVDWEILPGSAKADQVTWRYLSPDGSLEARKKFSVLPVDVAQPEKEADAYQIQFELTLHNHAPRKQTLVYALNGPSGVPIENIDYTQKIRELVAGFVQSGGSVKSIWMKPDEMLTAEKNNRPEIWRNPVKYIGTDVQYFTVLLIPQGDQNKDNYLESSNPIFADGRDLDTPVKAAYRDVSVRLTSTELELAAATPKQVSTVTHSYKIYAGPKRVDLLQALDTEPLMSYGVAGYLGIPQLLLAILGLFHKLLAFAPWPYGWSIILLTILVRGCMYPMSRKQALSAAKMQNLKPEMVALKKKYEKQPERFQKEMWELYRKHDVNPVGGCLPLFIQLPIFIGLYQALNISVDLRGAHFLWISNLAAPDELFRFGFTIPLLGIHALNLLPIITVVLYVVQSNMLMPPATSPEEEMQHKMMMYMTIGFGFMFYSMPSGLCVYFIASTLWALAERKLMIPQAPIANPNIIVVTPNTPGKK